MHHYPTKNRLPGKLINPYLPASSPHTKHWKTRVRITPEKLLRAGYKQVPSHAYAKRSYEQEWITNAGFMFNRFPRFHVIKDDGLWYIHLDERGADNSHGKTIVEDVRLVAELKRINQVT